MVTENTLTTIVPCFSAWSSISVAAVVEPRHDTKLVLDLLNKNIWDLITNVRATEMEWSELPFHVFEDGLPLLPADLRYRQRIRARHA